MTYKTTITLLGTLLLNGLPAFAAPDPDALNLAVADDHLIPAYARLAQATTTLDGTARQHCAAGSTGIVSIREAYAQAFLAWQGIQHIRFGPIQVLSRDFRFQLWPDKRGTVGKHLARLLASRDPALLEPDHFARSSAALQGFGALERMLYDDADAPEDRDWYCAVVGAMTANLERMATGTRDLWLDGDPPHRDYYATASSGNDYYGSADELSARLLNNLHTQLERIADLKLPRPLGDAIDSARPKQAEAWRSALSLPAIRANLEALLQLYTVGFAPRLDDAPLDAAIRAGFDASLAHIGRVDRPLAQAVTDPADREQLVVLTKELQRLKALVGGRLSETLGLPLGFNSLDGD
jgi:predicted lipoprotein